MKHCSWIFLAIGFVLVPACGDSDDTELSSGGGTGGKGGTGGAKDSGGDATGGATDASSDAADGAAGSDAADGAAGEAGAAGSAGDAATGGAGGAGGDAGATGGTGATGATGGTSGCPKPCDCDNDNHSAAGGACGGDDCDDNDADVHPGQNAWFTKAAKNGTFDYDCSGVAEKQYTTVINCVVALCPSGQGYFGAAPVCGQAADWGVCTGALCTKQVLEQRTQGCR